MIRPSLIPAMRRRVRWVDSLHVVAAMACASSAFAQEAAASAPAAEASQVVEIKQVRNPAMMSYRQASDFVSKVTEAGAHRLHALIRVTSSKTHEPMPDLRIVVEGEHTHMPLAVSAAGFVTLPLDPAAYADNADLIANQRKETLDVGIFVVPDLPAADIRYDDLAAAVLAGRSAINGILPWYLRLLGPSLKGVAFCYPDDRHAVALAGLPGARRAATEPEQDVTGNKVFCARFTTAEAAADKGRVLAPDAGWEALFW